MNHPKSEDWVLFAYGEATPQSQTELERHLQECPECQATVQTLKTTMRQLDTWKVPQPRQARPTFLPVVKWAMAASVVLLLGFTAGRVTAKPDATAIRAALLPELREQVKSEVARMVRTEVAHASALTLTTAADNADKVAATYANAIYASLKQDVDTVALHADASLRKTALQLNQLTDYQPVSLNQ